MVSRQDLPLRPPIAKGDLEAIANEFRQHGVGPLMMDEVREIAYLLVPKYNAAVYSEIGNWRHGFDDLVQDVAADSLLGEQQAAYLIETAHSIDSRRTAGNRKQVVYSILEDLLGPLVDSERLRCLDALGPSLRSAILLMSENV